MSTLHLVVLACFLNAAAPLTADTGNQSSLRKTALESELRLARKPGVYFVIDLNQAQVVVKARGMSLKALSIIRKSVWGSVGGQQPRRLESKSALSEPDRLRLKPGQREEKAPVPALEVSDMPSRYLLHLSGGLTVGINSEPAGIVDRLASGAYSSFWATARPILSLRSVARGIPFEWIELSLSRSDAQALYWVLSEGTQSVIYAL